MFQRVLSPNSFLKFHDRGKRHLITYTYLLSPMKLGNQVGSRSWWFLRTCSESTIFNFSTCIMARWPNQKTPMSFTAKQGLHGNFPELNRVITPPSTTCGLSSVCVYRLNRRKTSYTLYIYMRGVPEALMRPALTKTLISCLWYRWGRSFDVPAYTFSVMGRGSTQEPHI